MFRRGSYESDTVHQFPDLAQIKGLVYLWRTLLQLV